MPLYDYKCEACNKAFEEFNSIEGRYTAPCPHCGNNAALVILKVNKDWFKPHWNENFDLDPIYVESRGHMKELCKDYGVYSKALGPIDDRRGS